MAIGVSEIFTNDAGDARGVWRAAFDVGVRIDALASLITVVLASKHNSRKSDSPIRGRFDQEQGDFMDIHPPSHPP
jgi:hypothetical protein